jgi:hypothetical protein
MAPMRVDTVDEWLSESDVLVMGISPIIAVGSRYLYGALEAIRKARRHNCALVFYISDWQVPLLTSSVTTILNGPHRLTKYFMRHRTDFFWANHHVDELLTVVQALKDRPWPGTLIPSHPWRNDMPKISRYVPARRLYFFDPTIVTSGQWAPHSVQATPDERKREWVMAALGDYDAWLQQQCVTWPVRSFGGKTNLIDENGNKIVNPRVQEPVIHENYAQVWGGLGPKHGADGMGWWRSRWDFILKNGGIIFGSNEEMSLMGGPFVNRLSDIESMTTPQLVELQNAQRAAHRVETMEQVTETFRQAIADARAEL